MKVFVLILFLVLLEPIKWEGNGLETCIHPNDKPTMSGKGFHLDEQCCLDYDEYPNPQCFYGYHYRNLFLSYYKIL
jgi:hypothetical protein